MEARTKTVEGWFSMIAQGQVALPRFQRHEAWRHLQVEGVLENVLRNPPLPIGALLTLEVGNEEIFHSCAIVGAPPITARPHLHLLDGQQRMTALWRSMHDDYEDVTAFVSLEHESVPDVEIVKRWHKGGVKQPVWADIPEQVHARNLIPVSVLCPGSVGEARLRTWCTAAKVDHETMFKVGALRTRLSAYGIPFLSLPVGTSAETALNVFINMNTSATPLRDLDIVVAQLEGSAGASLHSMMSDLRQSVPQASHFHWSEDLTLSVAALVMAKPPLKTTYLEKSSGKQLAEKLAADHSRDSARDGVPGRRRDSQ